jgi:hypothetical protein
MKKAIRTALVILCTAIFQASCIKSAVDDQSSVSEGFAEIVYVQTNDPEQNAIIAYQNNGDGQLHQLPGSPFLTGGKGIDHYSTQVVNSNA